MKKTIDIYITKVCNLNCEYCYVELENTVKDFNSQAFHKKIHLLEYRTIRFIGGEPLMKWNDIVNIVEMVRLKDPSIAFHIITNGLLFTESKIKFIEKHQIIIENSLHFQSLSKTLSKRYLEMVFPIRELIRFSIIFEPHHIQFPRKIISLLMKSWFFHFIVSPEVYSNWNDENIALLQWEIIILLDLVKNNRKITFHGPEADQLILKKNDCHKVISDETGDTYKCNRINKIPIDFTYDNAFDFFNSVNQCYSCEKKWFCICPVSWYLDHLDSPKLLPIKAKMFHILNKIFIEFASEIQKIRGNKNFLTWPYKEIRLNLTNQCNLRCNYCYLDYSNQELSYENAANIIEWHLRWNGNHKMISFFGGEPLLKIETIKQIVEFAGELAQKLGKTIQYCIATNATLMTNEIAQFLYINHFDIHISWNGTPDLHNETRDMSYEKMTRWLDILAKYFQKEDIMILMGFWPKQVPLLFRSFEHIFSLWYRRYNFELFYGDTFVWDEKIYKILDIQIWLIMHQFGQYIYCSNIEQKDFIDISVDGSIWTNSFIFHHKKNTDFSPKEKLLSSIQKYKNFLWKK